MALREELIYLTQLAEQSGRYEDMVQYIKIVVEMGQGLSVEERNLLQVAYKNRIRDRRAAQRILSSIERKEEEKLNLVSQKNLVMIRSYKNKIEQELNLCCKEIFNLIDSQLVTGTTAPEARVFFYKMKGDYYRFILEYTVGDQHKVAAEDCLAAYQNASQIANQELKATNLIRLGLVLTLSVFYYEIINDVVQAYSIAKPVFDDAVTEIIQIQADEWNDTTTTVSQIRDNLNIWAFEIEENAKKKQMF